ncbi:MAG: OsmC family protein [Alphaproteobacteria bacterium]|nr:OsmC family protein [Alphaproteobacteria bacterium]
MKARVKWIEDRNFLGESDTGHAVLMGSKAGNSGVAIAPTPMEMILLGLGGCTSFDVVHILERGREAVTDCAVEMDADRAEEDPKVFTRIHLHFVVAGRGLNPAKVERAIALSAEKYCSASAMLAKTAAITHDFEIVDEN